eukprot:3653208-Rhodomonas_salina.1
MTSLGVIPVRGCASQQEEGAAAGRSGRGAGEEQYTWQSGSDVGHALTRMPAIDLDDGNSTSTGTPAICAFADLLAACCCLERMSASSSILTSGMRCRHSAM